MKLRFLPLVSLCGLLGSASLVSAQPPTQNYEEEIRRVRKELVQVQEEIARTADERIKDKEEFDAYRKRTLSRMRKIRQETDTIKIEVSEYQVKSDSLNALIDGQRNRKRQYEIRQDYFRSALMDACNAMLEIVQTTPPGAASKSKSAIQLLKNDLNSKSIDNVEGINRLMQITKDLYAASSAIQIVQGSSPIPEIRGTTYRLRVGTFFEAVVNAQGTRAAVWSGWDENGNATWETIDDPAIASQILLGVNVREGKKLPSLIELPLDNIAVVKGDKNEKE